MIYELGGLRPQIHEEAWIAPTAVIIGDVIIERGASVWWGAVIRGDTETIRIGEETNVQDGAVLHADPGAPCTLGKGITIGHQAMVHGCTVGDGSLIGIHAVVLNHAKIGKECLVGANALIGEKKEFEDRSMILGSPGRVKRTLDDMGVMGLKASAAVYVAKSKKYREALKRID